MWPFLQTPNTSCGCEQSGINQCGCDKISSLDVSYNGPALVCSGIELCDSLTVALQKIEAKICTAGNISGSGTTNYVSKWTPNGNTLGNSQIQDDGTCVAVGTNPYSAYRFWISDVLQSTRDKGLVVDHNYNGTNSNFAAVFSNTGASSGSQNKYGIQSGVWGSGSTGTNVGLYGYVTALNSNTSIGGWFYAVNGANKYSVQLQDGTEGIGKVLTCQTLDGKANWVTPTTGLSGSGINNYVARWHPDGTTLTTGLIRDDGSQLSIKTTPLNNTLVTIDDSVYPQIAKITQRSNAPINVGLIVEAIGVGGANTAISGTATGSTINIGVNGAASNPANINYGAQFFSGNATTLNVGVYSYVNGGTGPKYAVKLEDGTEGLGKVLTCVGPDGEANWATPISGSGTDGYVARWTPSGTQLGTGIIQDDNTSIGIKTSPNSDRLINAVSSTHRFGNVVEVSPTVTTPGQNTIAISGTAQGTNTGADTFGITGYASGSTSENIGVSGSAFGITTAKNIGGSFVANNSSVLNTAIEGRAASITTGINIGGKFEAISSTTANYAVQLKDGTEAVDKALTSVTSDGKANWNKISSSYTTGATGSFTSQDGKTITVTNGLITSII